MPKQGISLVRASLYLGWLMAKITGFKHEAILAQKAGTWDNKGVMVPLLPMTAVRTTKAYGVQMAAQRETLVTATLAILYSADSDLVMVALDLKESTFIFLACSLKVCS